VTLRARADEPSALDLDHAELVIELFEQVLEARHAAVGSPVVMTLRVEVGP
jgi:hypothetical protein